MSDPHVERYVDLTWNGGKKMAGHCTSFKERHRSRHGLFGCHERCEQS